MLETKEENKYLLEKLDKEFVDYVRSLSESDASDDIVPDKKN